MVTNRRSKHPIDDEAKTPPVYDAVVAPAQHLLRSMIDDLVRFTALRDCRQKLIPRMRVLGLFVVRDGYMPILSDQYALRPDIGVHDTALMQFAKPCHLAEASRQQQQNTS